MNILDWVYRTTEVEPGASHSLYFTMAHDALGERIMKVYNTGSFTSVLATTESLGRGQNFADKRKFCIIKLRLMCRKGLFYFSFLDMSLIISLIFRLS
jgi:hypothetical protein